jgi:glycerol-3-phosphate dehydrogenase
MIRDDGVLEVPGESVTDPVAFTLSLAAAAERHGAELRMRFPVAGIEPGGGGIRLVDPGGDEVVCRFAVNAAGLHADEIAALAGDANFGIYPRKGEFLVFEPPAGKLDRILLPVPSPGTKGVLVFPTVDGKVVAGPTAVDLADKADWTVRNAAREEILPRANAILPALDGAEPIAAYAGLRPAGLGGVNYLIAPSAALPELVNAAAIRSTGLSASLAIAERVCAVLADAGLELGEERPLEPGAPLQLDGPWWRRTAEHTAGVA